MILGIGNDIVEITRIKAVLTRYPERFLRRILTPRERDHYLKRKDPTLHLAGRFAAKEAIVKALGTGFSRGLTWLDIEILNDSNGKPSVFLSSFAKELFGNIRLLVSISHCHQFATACAIVCESSKISN